MASNSPVKATRPTLFNLPRELRQLILLHTINFTEFDEYDAAYTTRPYNPRDAGCDFFACSHRYNRHITVWNFELLNVRPSENRGEWQEDACYVCERLRKRLLDSINRFKTVRG